MLELLRRAWTWLQALFKSKGLGLKVVCCDEIPEALSAANVYLIGSGDYVWELAFLCPCGCEETLRMNLVTDTRPVWCIEKHCDGTISVRPSIWRQVGCQSHFYLERSAIRWVPSSIGPDIQENSIDLH